MGFLRFPYTGCLWGSAWRPFGPPELRYYHLYKINDCYNFLIKQTKGYYQRLQPWNFCCHYYKHQASSLDDRKMVLFWQQRIKLPLGNFSTGQLPIFQRGEIKLQLLIFNYIFEWRMLHKILFMHSELIVKDKIVQCSLIIYSVFV